MDKGAGRRYRPISPQDAVSLPASVPQLTAELPIFGTLRTRADPKGKMPKRKAAPVKAARQSKEPLSASAFMDSLFRRKGEPGKRGGRVSATAPQPKTSTPRGKRIDRSSPRERAKGKQQGQVTREKTRATQEQGAQQQQRHRNGRRGQRGKRGKRKSRRASSAQSSKPATTPAEQKPNRSLMRPAEWIKHPFAETLKDWEKGVPVDCGTPWSTETIIAAVARGPH